MQHVFLQHCSLATGCSGTVLAASEVSTSSLSQVVVLSLELFDAFSTDVTKDLYNAYIYQVSVSCVVYAAGVADAWLRPRQISFLFVVLGIAAAVTAYRIILGMNAQLKSYNQWKAFAQAGDSPEQGDGPDDAEVHIPLPRRQPSVGELRTQVVANPVRTATGAPPPMSPRLAVPSSRSINGAPPNAALFAGAHTSTHDADEAGIVEVVRRSRQRIMLIGWTTSVLFTVKAIMFVYRPITGEEFSGWVSWILYPWFFYPVPELVPSMLVLWLTTPAAAYSCSCCPRWCQSCCPGAGRDSRDVPAAVGKRAPEGWGKVKAQSTRETVQASFGDLELLFTGTVGTVSEDMDTELYYANSSGQRPLMDEDVEALRALHLGQAPNATAIQEWGSSKSRNPPPARRSLSADSDSSHVSSTAMYF